VQKAHNSALPRLKGLELVLMDEIRGPKYEEHFTAFVDLLGFSEFSAGTDDAKRPKVLDFLVSLAALRGEFDVQSITQQAGTTTYIKPAVSTFSDHIVISYPLEQISSGAESDKSRTALSVLFNFNELLARIASAALSIGFLIRGGATIGRLYHSGGVIFGEALLDAYQIESRTSIYPRVVLSSRVYSRENWMIFREPILRKGCDGLYYFDYFSNLVFSSGPLGEKCSSTAVSGEYDGIVFSCAPPGEKWEENMKTRFEYVIGITASKLADLEGKKS